MSKGSHSIVRQFEWATAVIVSTLLVLAHFSFMLHAGALWRDEVNTVHLATTPSLTGLWTKLQYDSFPLLWPLLLRGWVAISFGESDFHLRVLGLIVGIGLLMATWWTSRIVAGSVPLLSLILLAAQSQRNPLGGFDEGLWFRDYSLTTRIRPHLEGHSTVNQT